MKELFKRTYFLFVLIIITSCDVNEPADKCNLDTFKIINKTGRTVICNYGLNEANVEECTSSNSSSSGINSGTHYYRVVTNNLRFGLSGGNNYRWGPYWCEKDLVITLEL